MTRRPPKDVGASVRQLLLNIARQRNTEFQRLLVRYAIERLLYRLSLSPHRDRFMLKGAMLFELWTEEPHRGTRDLDLWGRGHADTDRVAGIFREVCSQAVDDDGLAFDASSVEAIEIREGQSYRGVRVRFRAELAGARIPMQVDIGFGDAVDPPPEQVRYPTLLDHPEPCLLAYPREVDVAEKLETMVVLGITNTRMKDFYDIAELANRFEFDGERVVTAIRSTFTRRRTPIPEEEPSVLSSAFHEDSARQAQWRAFLRRTSVAPDTSLDAVIETLRGFLIPPTSAAGTGDNFMSRWPPGGPWQ